MAKINNLPLGGNNARPVEVRAETTPLELYLRKFRFTANSSISELFIGDYKARQCFILERPYTGKNTRDNTATAGVNESEAILPGRYELTLTWSPAFRQIMLLVLNVPGRDGIRIHIANKPSELLGCLAPGNGVGTDTVTDSTNALMSLVGKIVPEMLNGRRVFLNIDRG
jgi:hypothetical protein